MFWVGHLETQNSVWLFSGWEQRWQNKQTEIHQNCFLFGLYFIDLEYDTSMTSLMFVPLPVLIGDRTAALCTVRWRRFEPRTRNLAFRSSGKKFPGLHGEWHPRVPGVSTRYYTSPSSESFRIPFVRKPEPWHCSLKQKIIIWCLKKNNIGNLNNAQEHCSYLGQIAECRWKLPIQKEGALHQSIAMFSHHLVMCSSILGELFAQCLT